MKKALTLLVCLFCPGRMVYLFLNVLGHNVSKGTNIGVSIIMASKLYLDQNSRIGHFNFIIIDRLLLRKNASILNFNFISGPFSVMMKAQSSIGNRNVIKRAKIGITYGFSALSLGKLTKITAGHKLDLTKSISFGNYSILAGEGTQMWTHGYYHDEFGPGRFRIDGMIIIGNNVYVGSRCVFNLSVKVVDAVIIGSNSSISKSLMEPCMYVSQPLRKIKINRQSLKMNLSKIESNSLIEVVYEKLL